MPKNSIWYIAHTQCVQKIGRFSSECRVLCTVWNVEYESDIGNKNRLINYLYNVWYVKSGVGENAVVLLTEAIPVTTPNWSGFCINSKH